MADPYQQLVAWWKAIQGSHELRSMLPNLETLQNGGLTAPIENAIAKALGTGDTLEWASRRPSELGYPDSAGEEKALRHLLLSAELQRTHPHLAGPLLYGHEYLTNVLHGQTLDNRYKDLHNNAIGRHIGQRSTSREAVEAWAQAAMPQANTRDYSLSDYQSRVPPADQPPQAGGR